MDEAVFFNPGDSIANSRDFKEARRSAEIFRTENPTGRKIVIAENDKDHSFAIYYADADVPKMTGHSQPHHIKDSL